MEAESIPSLSPLIQAADQWGELLLLLPLLVALEAVLSADNAIALAAISRRLHDPKLQRQALNLGLGLALVFRLVLIAAAQWVLDFWPLQLLAAGYLLWLCVTNLRPKDTEDDEPADDSSAEAAQTGLSGVVALRLTSGLFIRWLEVYTRLEAAGYLAVGLVGIRLLLRLAAPQVVPPEWALLGIVALLFAWGFSNRVSDAEAEG